MPAPNPKELEKTKVVKKTESTSTIPTVSIIGCGGFGVNILRKNISSFGDKVKVRILDTSVSNFTDEFCETTIIAGEGSGQIRKAHVDEINKYIASKGFETEPSDINILLFSMNGGTGSVIAPLITKELRRLNKVVIAICVTELTSQLAADNTFKTLKSIENICRTDNIYLPTMIFDNSVMRSKVDAAVMHRLSLLLKCLVVDIEELDKSDKINWLRPDVSIGVSPGIRGLQVSYATTGDAPAGTGELAEIPEGNIYDGIFMITSSQDVQISTDTRVSYHGILPELEHSIIGKLGFPISKELQKKINDALHKYEMQQSASAELKISSTKEMTSHNTGLCF
jgi:hypothetical protein